MPCITPAPAISSAAASATSRTLTVREYLALPRWRRIGYRLYRHPLVMFGMGPAYLFLVQHRLPVGRALRGWRLGSAPWPPMRRSRWSSLPTMWLVGVGPFLLVHLPIMLLAASIGVWLFYVQHQFEETFWAEARPGPCTRRRCTAARTMICRCVLRWFTANIGVHHVHHLCSRIPYYRLPRVLRDHPELKGIGRLTLLAELRAASAWCSGTKDADD